MVIPRPEYRAQHKPRGAKFCPGSFPVHTPPTEGSRAQQRKAGPKPDTPRKG